MCTLTPSIIRALARSLTHTLAHSPTHPHINNGMFTRAAACVPSAWAQVLSQMVGLQPQVVRDSPEYRGVQQRMRGGSTTEAPGKP
eukprot:2370790-Alexandrium_andersonii.AAC.1